MNDLYIESRLQAIKDIASASCADIKDSDNIASFCDEIYSSIPDIGKIVEELEKLQTYNMSLVTLMSDLQKNGVCRHYICLEDAIEIVKQGSVSDDVCEWTKSKDYPFDWFVGCEGCEVNHKQGDYCPICGKKIKVVESD